MWPPKIKLLSRLWLACPLLLGSLVACYDETAITSSPTDLSRIVAATATAISQPEPTPMVSTLVVAAPSAQPTPTPAMPPTRVNFLSGATTGVVSGSIGAQKTVAYVLQAGQDQPMLVQVQSSKGDVTLSIRTQGGTWLLPPGAAQSAWKGTLPQTEDYLVTLYGGAGAQQFTLSIEIASRIKFAPGADAAKISGSTVGGNSVAYTMFVLKDQKVEITLYGLGGKAALAVWGFADGKVLLGTDSGKTSFTFKAALTQDYILEIVPKLGQVLDFVIFIKIQ